MARAQLRSVLIDQAGNTVANQEVNIYQTGTSTPPIGSMYAAASGGSPVVSPRTSDASGVLEVWLEYPQVVDFVWSDSLGAHRVAVRSQSMAPLIITEQYVHPDGNDDNDGLSWETPKETILAAYDAITSGKIYIFDGSYVGGEVPHQGIWIIGENDHLVSTPPTGWRPQKFVDFIGFGSYPGVQFGRSAATINGGQPGTAGAGWDVEDYTKAAIHLAGVYTSNTFERINVYWAPICFRLGISADLASRSCATAHVTMVECAFDNGLADPVERTNKVPVGEIGYLFWSYFDHCVFLNQRAGREDALDFSSDSSSAVVCDPGSGETTLAEDIGTGETTFDVVDGSVFRDDGPFLIRIDGYVDPPTNLVPHSEILLAGGRTGNTLTGVTRGAAGSGIETHITGNRVSVSTPLSAGLVHFDRIISAGGGLKYYSAPTTWNIWVNDWLQEGDFVHPIGATVQVLGVDDYGFADINNVQAADTFSNTEPLVRISKRESSPRNAPAAVRIASIFPEWVEGDGAYFRDIPFGTGASPVSPMFEQGAIGFVGSRFYGRHDGAVRAGGASAVPFVNLADQDTSGWSGLGGTATVTAGEADVYGGTNAAALSASGDPEYRDAYRAAAALAAGDIIVAGVWAKCDDAEQILDSFENIYFSVETILGGDATFTVLGQTVGFSPVLTEGNWQFIAGFGVVDTPDATAELIIRLYAGDGAGRSYCFPVLSHIPAGALDAAEAAEMMMHLWTWAAGVPAGDVGVLPGQSFYLPSGALHGSEIATPDTPAANKWVLYAKDVGGKTGLYVKFADGSEQQIKVQP